eukprot:1159846-Pelagomonas_calceolata.AAC.11
MVAAWAPHCNAQPEEMDARLLSALIVGIRRAFPFVATEVGLQDALNARCPASCYKGNATHCRGLSYGRYKSRALSSWKLMQDLAAGNKSSDIPQANGGA